MAQNTNVHMEKYLIDECIAMMKYLSAEGSAIPPDSVKLTDINRAKEAGWNSKEILNLHKNLSTRVAPARPKTISLLYREAETGSWFNF